VPSFRRVFCLCLALSFLWIPGSAASEDERLAGTLVVAHGEQLEGDGPRTRLDFALVDDEGTTTPLVLKRGVDPAPFVGLAGRRVVISTAPGRRVPEAVAVREIPFESKARSVARTEAIEPAATGTHPFLTILCRFSDSTDVTPFREESANHFFTGSGQRTLPDYWREVSYGAVDLAGSRLVGWVNLPKPRSYYVTDVDEDGQPDFLFQDVFEDAIAEAHQVYSVRSYAGVNLVFNEYLISYNAWESEIRLSNVPGVETIPVTFVGPQPPSRPGVYAHEMGHALGLPHSSGPYADAYDSDWDIMSLGASVHTIGFHKDLAGWIPDARRVVSRTEATKQITLAPLSEPNVPGALLGIVPIDDEGTRFYTIEARRRTSYDFFVPADGVLIHLVDLTRANRVAQVVDATPDNNPNDSGGVWTVGERFTDPASGVYISVDAAAGSAYTVTVGRVRFVPNACMATVPTNRWKGEYFATSRTFGALAVRDEGTGALSPVWSAMGPAPACGVGDNFSARWTRDMTVAEGLHRISIELAGAARIRIDGRAVFDKLHSPTLLASFAVDVLLTAGTHHFEVTYFDAVQSPKLSVSLDGPRPGFRIDVVQPPRSMAAGTSAEVTVRIVGVGGFRSPVTLASDREGGLEGGSIRFDDDTLLPGESTTATISVDGNALAGTLALLVEGGSGSLTASTRVLVRTRLGFTISCAPGSISENYGAKGEFAIVVTRDPGLTGPIEVRIPAGIPAFLKIKPALATAEGESVVFRFKVKKQRARIERLSEIQCVATDASGAIQLAALRLLVR
jgi:M6 family metalloprotease-like protein